tara:strand:- start:7491 stop:8288 length:798 start_codon:yes stop_codon:yes gene_type:complete
MDKIWANSFNTNENFAEYFDSGSSTSCASNGNKNDLNRIVLNVTWEDAPDELSNPNGINKRKFVKVPKDELDKSARRLVANTTITTTDGISRDHNPSLKDWLSFWIRNSGHSKSEVIQTINWVKNKDYFYYINDDGNGGSTRKSIDTYSTVFIGYTGRSDHLGADYGAFDFTFKNYLDYMTNTDPFKGEPDMYHDTLSGIVGNGYGFFYRSCDGEIVLYLDEKVLDDLNSLDRDFEDYTYPTLLDSQYDMSEPPTYYPQIIPIYK